MRPKITMNFVLWFRGIVRISDYVCRATDLFLLLIDTIQSTNKELTEVAQTMLLKVLQECQCNSLNVMTVGSIEWKGNKIAKLAAFLGYQVHETDAQSFLMKVVKLIKATNILNMISRENMW